MANLTQQPIDPRHITKPLQLLGAWLAALIVLDGAFLAAARTTSTPSWAPGLLTSAAVANVPVFLVGLFILLTVFRKQLMGDPQYAEQLRLETIISMVTARLGRSLSSSGLDILRVALGDSSLEDVSKPDRQAIRQGAAELRALIGLQRRESTAGAGAEIEAKALRELGMALLADRDWSGAAAHLDDYIRLIPNDWEAQYGRGVAHMNEHAGPASHVAALRAYNETIALIPRDVPLNIRGRLYTYRGAALKRLHRLPEAEADFDLARTMVTEPREFADLLYNLAGVYAMTGRRDEALAALNQLKDTGYLEAVRLDRGGYFRSLHTDREFVELVGESGTS